MQVKINNEILRLGPDWELFYEADAKAHGNLLNKEKQHTNLYT